MNEINEMYDLLEDFLAYIGLLEEFISNATAEQIRKGRWSAGSLDIVKTNAAAFANYSTRVRDLLIGNIEPENWISSPFTWPHPRWRIISTIWRTKILTAYNLLKSTGNPKYR